MFSQVSSRSGLYHQQTKNLLVSYSPKKLGFFWNNLTTHMRASPGGPHPLQGRT